MQAGAGQATEFLPGQMLPREKYTKKGEIHFFSTASCFLPRFFCLFSCSSEAEDIVNVSIQELQ